MSEKLWRVRIDRTIMVVADSFRDAYALAERHERDECSNEADFVDPERVRSRKAIPVEWETSIPYGGDGNSTCLQIWERSQATTPPLSVGDREEGK